MGQVSAKYLPRFAKKFEDTPRQTAPVRRAMAVAQPTFRVAKNRDGNTAYLAFIGGKWARQAHAITPNTRLV